MSLLARTALLTVLTASAFPVRGQEPPTWLELRDVPHGTLQREAYTSASLGTEREVVVYTPPGYEEGSGRYATLYLLHGAGSDQTSWTERGQAHVILDNLIAEGALAPLVVVMPYGYAVPRAPGGGRGDAAENRSQREGFNQDLINDVIPLIESRFRVQPDRARRAIAGLSLGGAQALALGLGRPDLFSRVAAFSAAIGAVASPEVGGPNWDAALADAGALNSALDLVWIACGTEDTLFDSNRAFSERLATSGVEHTFRVTRGGHTYEVWQRYLHEVAPQLFP